MKEIHILAGLVSLIAGALALAAAKGSPWHRASGRVFAIAMLVMTSTAVVVAYFLRPNPVNVMAGGLTFYFVCTAWLAVRRPVAETRVLLTGLMLGALVLSAFAFGLAAEALAAPKGRVGGVPAPPMLMFGVVGLAGALLDARLLWSGRLEGKARIARHLWRMTFAFWVATASFFLGQAKFFPEPIRKSGLLALPVLLVAGMGVYWLVRTLRGRANAAPRLAAGDLGQAVAPARNVT
jgi:uncharacterized membrane protein